MRAVYERSLWIAQKNLYSGIQSFTTGCYSAVYGYVGVSSILIRDMTDEILILGYFVITAVAMLVVLVQIARRFGRPA